jgi:glycosyltransferase involved in cell wall biosynthesis
VTLHQLLATAAPHDAVTNQAFAWQSALAREGVHGEVFAENVHPELSHRVLRLAEFLHDSRAAVLLRYSIWSRAAERALAVPGGRLGIVYHNITPGRLLAEASPMLAALCDRGRRELGRFAGRTRVAIADSTYNAMELKERGFRDPVVVPLLLELPAPPPPRQRAEPRILFVGRVAPNKRIEDLIRTIALVRRHLIPEAHLEIVGSADGFERYLASLLRFADRLALEGGVRFRGQLSDRARDRAYAKSGVYLSMSEHEGFCAPLLEALAHGLPVVARGVGAVPETLGGAGVVLPDGDCAAAAEAVARVLCDADLRMELWARAARRLIDVGPTAVLPRIHAALEPLLA